MFWKHLKTTALKLAKNQFWIILDEYIFQIIFLWNWHGFLFPDWKDRFSTSKHKNTAVCCAFISKSFHKMILKIAVFMVQIDISTWKIILSQTHAFHSQSYTLASCQQAHYKVKHTHLPSTLRPGFSDTKNIISMFLGCNKYWMSSCG